jgi:prepilin-type N-terminal cleavage/methylation domain-containing protein
MRSHNQKPCGPLSCSRRERERLRPLWLSAPERTAFTLVELLVVIGILAILAALITPAIFQARVSARNAAIEAEIDMLHMAIMNYKNEYGSFPPCTGPTTAGSDAAKHLQRLFPRATSPSSEFIKSGEGDGIDNDGDGAVDEAGETYQVVLSPVNSLLYWLEGYTGSPTQPLTGGNRKKLFDWDASRMDVSTGAYHPTGKPGSPYVYINSAKYGTAFGVYQSVAGFSPDTFQILCAGLDEQWGTDDDLSNFWKGTRGDQ